MRRTESLRPAHKGNRDWNTTGVCRFYGFVCVNAQAERRMRNTEERVTKRCNTPNESNTPTRPTRPTTNAKHTNDEWKRQTNAISKWDKRARQTTSRMNTGTTMYRALCFQKNLRRRGLSTTGETPNDNRSAKKASREVDRPHLKPHHRRRPGTSRGDGDKNAIDKINKKRGREGASEEAEDCYQREPDRHGRPRA